MRHYDFIGDVHGKAEQLKRLLSKLGYRLKDGAWRHPTRTAVFVGDLVDRGPEQVETLMLVRRMVDAGAALCVMGNHEHNAIGWVTPHPTLTGEFSRLRRPYHRIQHEEFLQEVEHLPEVHADLIAWMSRLPVLLELPEGIRVAHAVWDERHTPVIAAYCDSEGRLTEEGLALSFRRGHPLHTACEVVMKGVEAELPEEAAFVDAITGKVRRHVRLAWWHPSAQLRECALPMPGGDPMEFPDIEVGSEQRPVLSASHLHFIGHYWLCGAPEPLSPLVASVDYSGGQGMPLTAYRWEGERTLQARHFVQAL